MENIIFVDTHIVVWLFSGKTELFSKNALNEIQKCDLYISPIVKLELSYLFEIGRIKEKPGKVLNALNKEIGLKLANDNFAEVVEESIKHSWTRDPFDRIISAHSKLRGFRLLTKDQTILTNCKFAFWD